MKAQLTLAPLCEQDVGVVVEAWNRWIPKAYSMDQRLFRQLTFAHPSWSGDRSSLAYLGEELVGFMLARQVGVETIVDAIAVAPHLRRQKLAQGLLESLGSGPLRFGGGPSHFVPGVPESWSSARAFFESSGFEPDWEAEDLFLPLASRRSEFTACCEVQREAVLEMVSSEFSRRWTEDTRSRFQHGDIEDVVILLEGNEPVAFCQTWHYRSQLLGPSVFWLRNTCTTFGGIGPVGVKASHRGRGLGRLIVEQALNSLAHKGVTEVVVDWTAIGPFYEKSGFKSWRRYRGYKRSEVPV